jgi:hypothetical protein
MVLRKPSIIAAIFAAVVLGTLLSALSWVLPWAASVAFARTPYDGNWSVLIVTDSGSCDRAYRYALRIADGRVYYSDPSFDVSGRVDSRGHVFVRVSAGGQSASGSGQLSANYGDGRWSGRSSTSQCSGHWEAERRG